MNEGKERKPGMLAQACVPSTGEAEAEALKMPGQPERYSKIVSAGGNQRRKV